MHAEGKRRPPNSIRSFPNCRMCRDSLSCPSIAVSMIVTGYVAVPVPTSPAYSEVPDKCRRQNSTPSPGKPQTRINHLDSMALSVLHFVLAFMSTALTEAILSDPRFVLSTIIDPAGSGPHLAVSTNQPVWPCPCNPRSRPRSCASTAARGRRHSSR